MEISLARQALELIVAILTETGSAAVVRSEQVSQRGVSQPNEVLISVEPADAASAQVTLHCDNDVALDVVIGEAIQLEYQVDMQNIASVLSELRSVMIAVIGGHVTEGLRVSRGRPGASWGTIRTRPQSIQTATFDTAVGWLFARRTDITYAAYPKGNVDVQQGPARR